MADRPIPFKAPMVRALLDGRKTQTRRTSGLKDVNECPDAWTLHNVGPLGYMAKASAKGKFGATFESPEIEPGALMICPQVLPYAPGDRLWVREAVRAVEHEDGTDAVEYLADAACIRIANTMQAADQWLALYHYGARGPDRKNREGQKAPPIHMPRWTSRLTLTVTDVRVQRLQEISEDDAMAEGCKPLRWESLTPRDHFQTLWNSIHGPGAWAANPWVAAISFDVHRCNIDQMPGRAG